MPQFRDLTPLQKRKISAIARHKGISEKEVLTLLQKRALSQLAHNEATKSN